MEHNAECVSACVWVGADNVMSREKAVHVKVKFDFIQFHTAPCPLGVFTYSDHTQTEGGGYRPG